MANKITKDQENKYKIKLNSKNIKDDKKIVIMDHTYSDVGIITNNCDFTKEAKSKLKEIIKKHKLSSDNLEDINKIGELIKNDFELSKKLRKKASKEEIDLDEKIKEMFYEPFPFVSYQNYITNLVRNNYHEFNKIKRLANKQEIEKSIIAYRENLKKWGKLIPRLETKLMKFLADDFIKSKLAVWQGFFRDKALSPLISSFLEMIYYSLFDNPNTKEVEWFILNMNKAFQKEKETIDHFIPLLEEKSHSAIVLGNDYSYALFGQASGEHFINYIFSLRNQEKEAFNKLNIIAAIMNNTVEKTIDYFETMMTKFVRKEKNFIVKLSYFSLIFCRDSFKRGTQQFRTGKDLNLGQRVLNYKYIKVPKEPIVKMQLHNIPYLINVYLNLTKEIYVYVKANFDAITKSTWKFLAMFFKDHSYLDSLYGATFINLQKTSWTKEQKIHYFENAFKNECKFYEKLLSLDENQLKSWILFAKYED